MLVERHHLIEFTSYPAPRCECPACQPGLCDPKLPHIRASAVNRLPSSPVSDNPTQLVYVVMMFVSYLIICLPTKYVSWINIWASAPGTRRPAHHDSPAHGQVRAQHQLRAGHLHARVQPDGLADGLGVLHGAPLTHVIAFWYNVATHDVEKAYAAARNVPRAMVWSGWSSVFLRFISLALCTTAIDSLARNTLERPIGVLIGQVLGVTGGVVLLSIHFVC